MRRHQIHYRKGVKYQLAEDYRVFVAILPKSYISGKFVDLSKSGLLTMYAGFAWDGPSGPMLDTRSAMRASLVHDALYYLMCEGKLDPLEWRDAADAELRRIYEEDVGIVASRENQVIGLLRRAYAKVRGPGAQAAVNVFGGPHATAKDEILSAP